VEEHGEVFVGGVPWERRVLAVRVESHRYRPAGRR
jgi:hypothetical protein